MAELFAVKPKQGIIDGGKQAKPGFGDGREDEPAIHRRPGTLNQSRLQQAVDQPGDVGKPSDHPAGNFLARQRLPCPAGIRKTLYWAPVIPCCLKNWVNEDCRRSYIRLG